MYSTGAAEASLEWFLPVFSGGPVNTGVRRLETKVIMKRLQRRDVAGERVSIGDMVRVIGAPDLTGMSPSAVLNPFPFLSICLESTSESRSLMSSGWRGSDSRFAKGLTQATTRSGSSHTY